MDIKVEDTDLYELFGINIDSTVSDIKKAYRKKALECHPDKNPDNPNAAVLFHQLSKALEILTDSSARLAYDKVLRAKKATVLRHKELDARRKKLKEDLERRENLAECKSRGKQSDEQLLQNEIERLRKEGSRILQEEAEKVRKTLEERLKQTETLKWDSSQHRIKIKWNADKNDINNGGYNHDLLHRFLSKYGKIVGLVVSQKKKGTALVEFETQEAAEMAVQFELGLPENSLKLEWVNESTKTSKKVPNKSRQTDSRDFETLTERSKRQAEERRKLIEQMQAEDG